MSTDPTPLTQLELCAAIRRENGVAEGTIYDPAEGHELLPALCFGPLPEDLEDTDGQHLRPELDILQSAYSQGLRNGY